MGEQANSLVNAAISDLSIGKLGVVVMDELHMLDDESRGYILELMATKLLSLEQQVQIIGQCCKESISVPTNELGPYERSLNSQTPLVCFAINMS
jgi:uncharacterized protein Smg (DUF494 family)